MASINTTHLKVLLKKDFLTLWRNKAYIVAFIALPLLLIWAFSAIVKLVVQDAEEVEGSLIFENFKYTSNKHITYEGETSLANFGDVSPFAMIENEDYDPDADEGAAGEFV